MSSKDKVVRILDRLSHPRPLDRYSSIGTYSITRSIHTTKLITWDSDCDEILF